MKMMKRNGAILTIPAITVLSVLAALLGGCQADGRAAYRIAFDTGISLVETGYVPAIDTVISAYAGDVMDRLPEPAWTGYVFRGWYDRPEDGAKIEAPWTPEGDTTLYAYWGSGAAEEDDYKITFNAGDGVFSSGEATLVKYIRRPPWTVVDMPIARKTGKAFGGWFTQDNGGGNEFTPVTKVPELADAEKTLYSSWIDPGSSFTVTFKSYGGKWADSTSADKTITVSPNDEGVILVGDQFPEEPALAGFVSAGWFVQLGTQTVPFSGKTFINKDITVFPVWDLGSDFTPPASVDFTVTDAGIAGTDSDGVTYAATVTGGTSFDEVNGKKVAVFATKNVSRVDLHRMAGKYIPGNQWTMEMYIKAPTIRSNDKLVDFFSGAGSGQAGSFWIEDSASEHRLLFRAFPRSTEQLIIAGIPPQNTWAHIAYVKDGSTLTCYVNGENKGSDSSFGVFSSNAAFNAITSCRFGNVAGVMLYQFTMRNSAPALSGTDLADKAGIMEIVDALNGVTP